MVAISKKPTKGVTGLGAPTRASGGSHQMDASWKVRDRLTNTKYDDRITGLLMRWRIDTSGADVLKEYDTANQSKTSTHINLNNFTSTSGTAYTRNSFYPYTGLRLIGVKFAVAGFNRRGTGPWVSNKRTFLNPLKPAIADPTFNKSGSTGTASAVVTTDAGNGYRERARTRVIVSIEDTYKKRNGQKWSWNSTDTYTTNTSYTASYDAANYQGIGYDDYIKVTFKAYAQGYAGDSDTASKTYYISYPAKTTIAGVDVSSRGSTGKVTLGIKTNATKEHPVDQVVLEYLADTSYMKASDIPGTETWTASGIKDNGNCEALAIATTNLIPTPGKRTWCRVKSWHADEDVLYRYSEYVALTELETPAPSAQDDSIVILGAESAADGQGAVITLGWNADGTDDADGTQLSWSTNEGAWRSTEEPDTYEFTWSDGQLVSGNTTYQDSATITIAGLEEGDVYYVRAQRYLTDVNGVTTYSGYSATKAVMPSVAPSNVVLDVPRYLPDGSSVQAAWTYGGGGTQREWQIVAYDGTVVASGSGVAGGYEIPYERAIELATSNNIQLRVDVSTGSGFVSSSYQTVSFVPAPTLSITVGSTLAAQPLSFTAASSAECTLAVIVQSQGVDGQTPTGIRLQPDGETVYAGAIQPAWTYSSGTFSSTVSIPSGRDFIDNGDYTLIVSGTDPATGLSSNTVMASVHVAWTNQAVAPNDMVTLLPNAYTDEQGETHRTVGITLDAPNTVAATDVFDVYRLVNDHAELVGEGLPLDYEVTDEYAPFGKDASLAYRVALRTTDGDVEFADFPYTLVGRMMRIDFDGGYVELPNDIAISDSYAKDVAVRTHLDGTSAAYYNEGITRKASLSTRVIRIMEAATEQALRKLAATPGTAFVRLPDGSAYEADVQVNNMSTTGTLLDVAINAEQVTTTGTYSLPLPAGEE